MEKITKSLSLDSKAVERGERYSELHSTTLSQLVSDFLAQLPLDTDQELTPIVRRLLGVAAGGPDEHSYHEYLIKKYGS